MRSPHAIRFLSPLVLLLASGSGAQPCQPRDATKLKTFVTSRIEKPAPATLLAYDHDGHCWSAYELREGTPPKKGEPAPLNFSDVKPQFDVNGKPRLSLAAGEPVIVVVLDTNAALYTADRLPATEIDSEKVALAGKLAGLLGGLFGTAVQVKASPAPPPAAVRATVSPRPPDELKDLEEDLQTKSDALRNLVKSYVETSGTLQKKVDAAGKRPGDVVRYVQDLEAGRNPKSPDLETNSLEEIETALDGLRTARDYAPDTSCQPVLGLLRSALVEHGKEADRLAAKRANVAITGQLEAGGCAFKTDTEKTKTLRAKIEKTLTWLVEGEALEKGELGTVIGAAVGAIDVYLDLATVVEDVSQKVDKVLAKSGDLVAAGAALEVVRARLERVCESPAELSCTFLLVDGPLVKAKWNKAATGKFKLKALPVLGATIVRKATRADDLELSYDVTWRGENVFGFGPGITYTPLTEASWAAVSDPTEGSTKKFIARSKETSRAGQVALFVFFRPTELFRSTPPILKKACPALDLGAGLNTTDKASLFLGLGVDLFRYVHLGGGLTLQKVQRLAEGQNEARYVGGVPDLTTATFVKSSDDIRTRSGFDRAGYVSLTISIDSLPFFKTD